MTLIEVLVEVVLACVVVCVPKCVGVFVHIQVAGVKVKCSTASAASTFHLLKSADSVVGRNGNSEIPLDFSLCCF